MNCSNGDPWRAPVFDRQCRVVQSVLRLVLEVFQPVGGVRKLEVDAGFEALEAQTHQNVQCPNPNPGWSENGLLSFTHNGSLETIPDLC